jgi:hypothetical protein
MLDSPFSARRVSYELDFGWGKNWTPDCSDYNGSWVGLKNTYRNVMQGIDEDEISV